jgi:hypothetical protein
MIIIFRVFLRKNIRKTKKTEDSRYTLPSVVISITPLWFQIYNHLY